MISYFNIRTILTDCVFSSLLIAILCPLLKKSRILEYFGPNFSILILAAILLRMYLPFEFTYTYSIRIKKIWTEVVDFFRFDLVPGKSVLLLWMLLVVLWGIGLVYILIQKFIRTRRFWKVTKVLEEVPKEKFLKVIPELQEYPELKKVRIVTWQECTGPFVTGLFHPVIVLPRQVWSKEQMAYVLKHELLHCRYHDLGWKIFIDLFCTAFWWNPLFTYLKRELFQMIEVKNDQRIIKSMTQEQRIEYIQCLVYTAKNLGRKDQGFGIAFSKNDMRELKQRISLITTGVKGKQGIKVVTAIILLGVVFSSTCFVLEPNYQDSVTEGDAWLDETNTYLIHNGDTYDVYINIPSKGENDSEWEYLFSDPDRSHFSEKVQVYEEGEEIEE